MTDDRVTIERLGGLAGFGLAGSALRSEGEFRVAQLDPNARRVIESLFEVAAVAGAGGSSPARGRLPDAFYYRLTWARAAGVSTIEVAEEDLPQAVKDKVSDRLA